MQKLHRNYKIQFEIGHFTDDKTDYIPEDIIEISYPTTLHLTIDHNPFALTDMGRFQLYNLSQRTQDLLHKDIFDQNKYVTMKLFAGYQDVMPCIFWGDFTQCYSTRASGSVDFITTIEATNTMYMFMNGFVNNTYSENTTFFDLINDLLASSTTQIEIGYITKKIQPLQSDQTFLGNMYDLIRGEYPDYQIFIDNNKLNILADDEVIPGDIQVITSRSGLLGSPIRRETYLDIDCIFEPGLKVGQAITVISQTTPYVNKTYKIAQLRHTGVISPVEAGDLITRVSVFYDSYNFEEKSPKPPTYGELPAETTNPNSSWVKPLAQYRVSSPYGYRMHPIKKKKIFHTGIDLAAPAGTPIMAARNGVIATVGWGGGYGKMITINHGQVDGVNMSTAYCHMSEFAVSVGQNVSAGQIIGKVGNTGQYADGTPSSTNPHCHFEIRKNGQHVNPTQYINFS